MRESCGRGVLACRVMRSQRVVSLLIHPKYLDKANSLPSYYSAIWVRTGDVVHLLLYASQRYIYYSPHV